MHGQKHMLELVPIPGRTLEDDSRAKERFYRLQGAAERLKNYFKLRLDDRFFFISNGFQIRKTCTKQVDMKCVRIVSGAEGHVPPVYDNMTMAQGDCKQMSNGGSSQKCYKFFFGAGRG